MLGARPSDRIRAETRNADHPALIVDRSCSRVRIARIRREQRDLVQFWAPDYRLKLQKLARRRCIITGWIENAILRPADHLSAVVNARGIAVIPSRKRRKRRHHAVLPREPQTNVARRGRRWKKGKATPGLAIRIRLRRFCNSYNLTPGRVIRPTYIAVRPS